MKKSKILVLGSAVGLALSLPMAAGAASGISGSVHDFTGAGSSGTNLWGASTTWVPNGDVCEECHTIHNNNSVSLGSSAYKSAGPLWAHTLSTATWTPYTSPNLPTGGTPGWSSIACLSCHDGSVAINSLNGATPTSPVFIAAAAGSHGNYQIGPDLSGTHPIGVNYTTFATNEFRLPTLTVMSPAGADGNNSVQTELLFNETGVANGAGSWVECASCHDIHRVKGNSGASGNWAMIKVGAVGSGNSVTPLCLSCHIK